MSRTKKVETDIIAVKSKIREAIEKKYGSVAKFLTTDKAKELGGTKIRAYLYDSGAVNLEVLNSLCKYLGLGTLSRNIVVERKVSYYLTQNNRTESAENEE